MPEDIEVKVTTTRKAEARVTLGPQYYTLTGESDAPGSGGDSSESRAPYVQLYSGARLLEIREADWPAFRDAVDKLFAALRAEAE